MKNKGYAKFWRTNQVTNKVHYGGLSIRRFWGKRGKIEAKKGENSPLLPLPSKFSSPLAPWEGLILRLALWEM